MQFTLGDAPIKQCSTNVITWNPMLVVLHSVSPDDIDLYHFNKLCNILSSHNIIY